MEKSLKIYMSKIIFVQEISSACMAAAAVNAVAEAEAEPTARPTGLCGKRRAAQPSADPSFMDAVEEVCKNYFIARH